MTLSPLLPPPPIARPADLAEGTVWEGAPSTFGDMPIILGGVTLAILGSIGLQALIPAPRYDRPAWITEAPTYFFWGMLGLTLLRLCLDWVQNRTTRFTLTTERLIMRRGILSVTTDDLELFRVRDLQVELPIHLRIFGLGTVVVMAADNTTPLVRIEAQGEPEALRDLLRRHVAARQTARGYREMEVT